MLILQQPYGESLSWLSLHLGTIASSLHTTSHLLFIWEKRNYFACKMKKTNLQVLAEMLHISWLWVAIGEQL